MTKSRPTRAVAASASALSLLAATAVPQTSGPAEALLDRATLLARFGVPGGRTLEIGGVV